MTPSGRRADMARLRYPPRLAPGTEEPRHEGPIGSPPPATGSRTVRLGLKAPFGSVGNNDARHLPLAHLTPPPQKDLLDRQNRPCGSLRRLELPAGDVPRRRRP